MILQLRLMDFQWVVLVGVYYSIFLQEKRGQKLIVSPFCVNKRFLGTFHGSRKNINTKWEHPLLKPILPLLYNCKNSQYNNLNYNWKLSPVVVTETPFFDLSHLIVYKNTPNFRVFFKSLLIKLDIRIEKGFYKRKPVVFLKEIRGPKYKNVHEKCPFWSIKIEEINCIFCFLQK